MSNQQLRFEIHREDDNNSYSYFTLLKLCVVVSVIHLSGCASIEVPVEELPDIEEVPPLNEDQQRVIESQEKRIKELEQRLAEKNIEIKQKSIREKEQEQVIEAASHEITRAQIKLHRLATRSSSASLIAEAEVAMGALKRRAGGNNASDAPLQAQAQQLLDAAGLYFSQNDYASATHYASQSVEFINMTADSNRELPNRPTVAFNLPIRLQTIANANLRQAPAMNAAVRTVLKEGTYLTATAYQGSWLRVQTENSMQGWVSNTLIKVANNGEF